MIVVGVRIKIMISIVYLRGCMIVHEKRMPILHVPYQLDG